MLKGTDQPVREREIPKIRTCLKIDHYVLLLNLLNFCNTIYFLLSEFTDIRITKRSIFEKLLHFDLTTFQLVTKRPRSQPLP